MPSVRTNLPERVVDRLVDPPDWQVDEIGRHIQEQALEALRFADVATGILRGDREGRLGHGGRDAGTERHGKRHAYSSASARTRPERMAFTSAAWSFRVWSA